VDNDGWTALMNAAKDNQVDSVKALLKAGADVAAASKEGDTALSVTKNPTILHLLKAAGAK
jgi:ankyrin repeat protein